MVPSSRHWSPIESNSWWRAALLYCGIVFTSALVAAVGAEIYLSHTMAPRLPLPFYNRLSAKDQDLAIETLKSAIARL